MPINLDGQSYVQNFDTLIATGIGTDVPDGWAFMEAGTSANASYTAGTGSSSTGDTYSFGVDADRAFGRVQSGSNVGAIGAAFTNATDTAIASLDIHYTGEEWRLGTAGRADHLDFQISFDATSLTSGTWTNVDALDFSTPDMAGVGAKNGNLAADQLAIGHTLANLDIAAGTTFWVRWNDADATGADDGLAIDDFSITAHGAEAAAPVRLFAEDFSGFTAAGFAPEPGAGQLDSDVWRVGGLSDEPNPGYGETLPAGGDFGRGVINGSADPFTAGVYSPSADGALVVQPTGAEFDNGGFIEARIANSSGQTATSFDVGFDWTYRNSGDRADPLSLSYSTDGVHFTALPDADFTTPQAKDAAVAATFSTQHETVTISDVAVPDGGDLYLRWSTGASTGSGNRDEVGIDNVTVDAGVTDQPLLSVTPVSVTEGDNGTTDAVFTFTRTSGVGAASVDYATADGTATAGSDYLATSGTVSFADGETTKTVAVSVIGDTRFEGDETFTLQLSHASGVLVPATSVTSTIVNDDQNLVHTYEIQGAGHLSPLVGQAVETSGIVTTVGANGFYIQDPTGDGDRNTSDGLYVFTGVKPTVAVGDAVDAHGTVAEYSADPGVGLTTTELNIGTGDTITVSSHGNALPAATVIGVDGLLPPTQLIDGPDGLASYDPTIHGVDFYESLEGMRITVETPQVIQTTNSFGETYVVASDGVGATNVAARGGLTLGPGDFNPERIQIDDTLSPGIAAGTEGDHLASVTGVVGYSFDEYEVLAAEGGTLAQAGSLARETTALHGDADHLSVATYNVENLDASDGKYATLAHDIITNLGGPDILSLQEIQDDSGATDDGTVTAQQNLTNLTNALNAADPTAHYVYAEIDPANDTTGGEPGGNIRNAFVFDTNRVSLKPDSLTEITGAAYTNSRNPLVGTFSFNGQDVTLVNVHSYSRGGSDPDFGAVQPAVPNGDDRRTAMADGVRDYINAQLATDPDHQFAVMGDFNGFYYETAFQHLTADGVLTNLSVQDLAPEERYSYQFDGSLQEFDYILTTGGLSQNTQYDSVHINAEFANTDRPTDHDPQVALLTIERAVPAPADLQLVNDTGRSATDGVTRAARPVVVGTGTAGDTVTLMADGAGVGTATVGADGRWEVHGTTALADGSHALTAIATAADGSHSAASVVLAVTVDTAAPDGPGGIAFSADGAALAAGAVTSADAITESGTAEAGSLVTLSANGKAIGTAVTDEDGHWSTYISTRKFSGDESFTATATDAAGNRSTASAGTTLTFFHVKGGHGDDVLTAPDGQGYTLKGRDGDDVLTGNTGTDHLKGGTGDDRLVATAGHDKLVGDDGADHFVLSLTAGGNDAPVLADFTQGVDHLEFSATDFGGSLADHSLDPNAFWSNTTGRAHDADDRFIYNSAKGTLYYDEDGSGSHAAVLIAHLNHHPALTAGDFIFS